jgi:hypothetical protein
VTAAAIASAATPATIVLEIELRMLHLRKLAFALVGRWAKTASHISEPINPSFQLSFRTSIAI